MTRPLRRRERASGRAAVLLVVFVLLIAAVFAAFWAKSSKPRVATLADAQLAADPNVPETIVTLHGPIDRHLVADRCTRRDMWACRDLFADLYEGGHEAEAMATLRSMNVALGAMPAKLRDGLQVDSLFAATKALVAANGDMKHLAPGEIAILGIGTRAKEQAAADSFLRTRPARYTKTARLPAGEAPPQLSVQRSAGEVRLANLTQDHLVATVFGNFWQGEPSSSRPFQCYWIDAAAPAKVGLERLAFAPGQARTLKPGCVLAAAVQEGGLDFIVFDAELGQWVFLSPGY